MRFHPSTVDDIAAHALWPSGIYPFRIVGAEEKTSQRKGYRMIELRVELRRRDGLTKIVHDYLLPQNPEKLIHACRVCGAADKYLAGEIDADDFIGKCGRLRLGIQRSKDWPTKNVVKGYV